ncbi:J domain-containing protein [Dyella acidiphila]|uniref:DnaJ domain-containing protein n=1 Tax=Dyella acidiphila TaxID=2775866 RepID=A0ABR9G5X3_9GAMM|nr:DnaJ domain-containing protein [Dyella acidiphila]MBE1159418.1 DnaJ domain-containing protein [Dyella acidiphila]
MTAVDIVVIAAGLLFGYRLVSNYLSPHGAPSTEPLHEEARQPERLPDTPPWYVVLEVPENAALAEIERAYRVKVSQYHPDKVAQMGDDIRQLAEARCKEINAAYDAAVRLRKPPAWPAR